MPSGTNGGVRLSQPVRDVIGRILPTNLAAGEHSQLGHSEHQADFYWKHFARPIPNTTPFLFCT